MPNWPFPFPIATARYLSVSQRALQL
uniref:Uncharacterized protein n=1 Tax=Anguilla anguilla TaxID=7936 RepID=A0A0E9R4N9_ANGAN